MKKNTLTQDVEELKMKHEALSQDVRSVRTCNRSMSISLRMYDWPMERIRILRRRRVEGRTGSVDDDDT